MKINWISGALVIVCFFDLSDCFKFFDENNVDDNFFNSKDDCMKSPVILIPGLGGSRIEAKLDKPDVLHWWCYKKSEYFNLWLSVYPVLSFDCWVDNLKLIYDRVRRKTKNSPGVTTRVPAWGETQTIEWIGEYFGAFYYFIVDALVEKGYVRGENLFGAPYDFRKGPNELKYWFDLLKHLTEYAFESNNDVGVTFIAYSMGGRMLLHFLQQMPQSWKAKYVKRVISLAVPWGGSVRAIQALSIGYDLDIVVLPSAKLNVIEKTFPSIVWLMPSEHFWEPNSILADIDGKFYTLENIDQFFVDIGLPDVVEMRKDLADYNNFTAPGVEMHCLFGSNIVTADSLHFVGKFNPKPVIVSGDGDGQVNRRSLIGCGGWVNTSAQGTHRIYQKEFSNVNHMTILSNTDAINYILDQLSCIKTDSDKYDKILRILS